MIVPATMAVGAYKPGSRLVVQYAEEIEDDKYHERLLLHNVADDEYRVLTPDGDRYVEAVSGYELHALMNGRASYPHNVKGAVHAFAEVLDTAEIKGYVLESRKSCLAEQVRRGCPETPAANFLDWDGALVALPDLGKVACDGPLPLVCQLGLHAQSIDSPCKGLLRFQVP